VFTGSKPPSLSSVVVVVVRDLLVGLEVGNSVGSDVTGAAVGLTEVGSDVLHPARH